QLLVANEEKISHRSFVRSHQRKKTEQRTGLARDISAYKLLRYAFRDPEDVSRVLVIIAHELLAAPKVFWVPRRIIEAFCDLFLQIDTVAEFLVAGDLILYAQFNVFSFTSVDTLRTKLPPKFACQIGIAREEPRFQHGSLCAHVLICLSDRFFDRARGVSNLET